MEINYSHGRLSSAQQSICPTVKSETREDQQISNYPPRDSTINKNVLPAINSLLNWKNSQKEGCMGGCNLACMWCQTQNSSFELVGSVVDRTERCDCQFAAFIYLFFSSNWSVRHFLGRIATWSLVFLLAEHTCETLYSRLPTVPSQQVSAQLSVNRFRDLCLNQYQRILKHTQTGWKYEFMTGIFVSFSKYFTWAHNNLISTRILWSPQRKLMYHVTQMTQCVASLRKSNKCFEIRANLFFRVM